MKGGAAAPGLAAILLVVALGGAALAWGTGGFTAFTAEAARRADVTRTPRTLPAVSLQDQDGAPATLAALRGKAVLLDFIYTRCPSVCGVQGSDFQRAREEIRAEGLQDAVALVSLSFDPGFDTPEELTAYAERFGGADPVWRFLRSTPQETAGLLRSAGVVVIPDELGGYTHNAAIHVLDRAGRLVAILDADAWRQALALARGLR